METSWRSELRSWANECTAEFADREGIQGVLLGGSLARGQEWRHSDLEIGVLVEERDPALPYFNIRAGRGVEVIQLVRRELEMESAQVEAGDLTPLLKWPIQLWKVRLVSDPTGQLARFKLRFDDGLFRPEVLEQRIAGLKADIQKILGEARSLLKENRPAAALVRARYAMNEAILVYHWAHGELPRSQSRTDSRLRLITRRHGGEDFYALYRAVFDLEDANRTIHATMPHIREQVLEISRLWGDTTRDFFDLAVDSRFAWRQNAGILTVYRLYIPIIGGEEHGLITHLDDEGWRKENELLVRFLGLQNANVAAVTRLVDRIAAVL